jgi:hypothetical protein
LVIAVEPLVFESWVAEVDQQSDFDARGVKVVDDLRLVFCRECACSLQLDDDFILK